MARVWPLCSALLAFSAATGVRALAQVAGPVCSPGPVSGIAYEPERAVGPYTAMVKTSFEQHLADGNTIHAFAQTKQARSSDGKMHTETPQQCVLDQSGQLELMKFVRVWDPNAKTSINWFTTDSSKTAHLTRMPPPRPRPKLSPEELEERRKAAEAYRPRIETHVESLGTQTIVGFMARGQRLTRTIPAGQEGNDQPLVTTIETWRSQELGFVLLAIDDDPRRGKTTYAVEEITRGEPDPALFVPPADYKLEERVPVTDVPVKQ